MHLQPNFSSSSHKYQGNPSRSLASYLRPRKLVTSRDSAQNTSYDSGNPCIRKEVKAISKRGGGIFGVESSAKQKPKSYREIMYIGKGECPPMGKKRIASSSSTVIRPPSPECSEGAPVVSFRIECNAENKMSRTICTGRPPMSQSPPSPVP